MRRSTGRRTVTCFVGFESGALYTKEAADPVRSNPLASYISVVLIGSFYLVTAWIVIGAIGPGQAKPMALAHGGKFILDLIKQYRGETASDVAGTLLCTSMLATYIAIHAAAWRNQSWSPSSSSVRAMMRPAARSSAGQSIRKASA